MSLWEALSYGKIQKKTETENPVTPQNVFNSRMRHHIIFLNRNKNFVMWIWGHERTKILKNDHCLGSDHELSFEFI